jgi:hypothetical protein
MDEDGGCELLVRTVASLSLSPVAWRCRVDPPWRWFFVLQVRSSRCPAIVTSPLANCYSSRVRRVTQLTQLPRLLSVAWLTSERQVYLVKSPKKFFARIYAGWSWRANIFTTWSSFLSLNGMFVRLVCINQFIYIWTHTHSLSCAVFLQTWDLSKL